MHEVRSHLEGQADWIASANSILHSLLIILQQQGVFFLTLSDQQKAPKTTVSKGDLQQLC